MLAARLVAAQVDTTLQYSAARQTDSSSMQFARTSFAVATVRTEYNGNLKQYSDVWPEVIIVQTAHKNQISPTKIQIYKQMNMGRTLPSSFLACQSPEYP